MTDIDIEAIRARAEAVFRQEPGCSIRQVLLGDIPALLSALEAANNRADEAEARRKCYECGSEMTACAQCNPELPTAELTALRARVAELEEQYADKVDGLESDLSSAVDVLFRRGDDEAREWIRLNYPTHYERFVARAALSALGLEVE